VLPGVLVAMSLPKTKSEVSTEKKAKTASQAEITNEYLAGTWCALVQQENSQYIFTMMAHQCCVHDSLAVISGIVLGDCSTFKRSEYILYGG
jgi:hypothetical protein